MNTRVAFAAVAVGAALLGGTAFDVDTAPWAGADTGTDLDPLAQLYGDTGFNSWTTTADTDLAALSPTLASDLVTSVDNFQAGFDTYFGAVTFTYLTDYLDPSAFSANPDGLLIPDNAIGDLATGLDYTLFASGLGSLDADLLLPLGSLIGF
jgi:hypothetical protein